MKFRGRIYPAAGKNVPHSGSVSWQWACDNRAQAKHNRGRQPGEHSDEDSTHEVLPVLGTQNLRHKARVGAEQGSSGFRADAYVCFPRR
jgi:hypothetical protein